MQRRIEQADDDRQAMHRPQDADEVCALDGQQAVKRTAALSLGLGQDHFLDDGQAIALAEHVLGAAKANALRTVGAGQLGLFRRVGIPPDLEPADFVGPTEQLVKLLRHLAGDKRHFAADHVAKGAVDGECFTCRNHLATNSEFAGLNVNVQDFAANNSGKPELPGHDGRVAGRASARRQDGLGGGHAVEVVGRGLGANQDDRVALLGQRGGIVGGKRHFAGRGARGCIEATGNGIHGR